MTAANPVVPDGAAGEPASTTATPTPSAPPEADYIQRAIANPQWGAEQMVQHQAGRDRAEAENKKLVEQYGPVKALVEQYGGVTVSGAVENYRALRNSEGFSEVIQEFERTGQLPTRTGSETKVEEDDEYKTPEEREMQSLRSEVAELRTNTNANTLASGREVLKGHMESVFSEYGFAREDIESMRNTMTSQFDTWQGAGPAGESAMKSIMTPGGLATVRGIMLSSITPEKLLAAASNTTSAKRQGLAGLSTDGPSGLASSGMEPPPEFKTAHEAAAWARANPDGHDSY